MVALIGLAAYSGTISDCRGDYWFSVEIRTSENNFQPVLLILLIVMPDSPTSLVQRGRIEEATGAEVGTGGGGIKEGGGGGGGAAKRASASSGIPSSSGRSGIC